jgi:uncharacterized repeat protein (TIGR01451 family)
VTSRILNAALRLSRPGRIALGTVLPALVAAVAIAAARPPQAYAATAWWHISDEAAPTNLAPGGEGKLTVVFSNLGDAPINGSTSSVVMSNVLPAGLVAIAITGSTKNGVPVVCSLATLSCSFKGIVYPYEEVSVSIEVEVSVPHGTAAQLSAQASVEGGGGTRVSRALPVSVSEAPPPFGLAEYELAPFNEDGSPATEAGSQPFQLTTTLAMNQVGRQPVQLPKDFRFHLPVGLVGNTTAAAQCSMANFFALVDETNLCSPASVVGVATVTANEPQFVKVFTKTVPVFNLAPARGEPARFGFEVIGKVPIVLDTAVRSGADYGVDVAVHDATETAGLLSSQVTIWGVPADPRHDQSRGWECVAGGLFKNQVGKPCPTSSGLEPKPFLRLPTSCPSPPVTSSVQADSWEAAESFTGASYEWISEDGGRLGFTGCNELPFAPSIVVAPEQHTAATPSGMSIELRVPQPGLGEAGGRATADVRNSTITLPPGVELSPSAANGLVGCPEAQVGFEGFDPSTNEERFSTAEAECPEASKLGVVHIRTPLLPDELAGALYLADPAPNGEAGRNPFDSLVAVYLVARDPVSGVLVKLAGEAVLDERGLRVTTVFRGTPQVPFEDLKVDLLGGPRASVSTPAKCGDSQADGEFTPWSGAGSTSTQSPAEDFAVTEGPGGAACPSGALAFAPGFTAFSTSPKAGAFTGFHLELTHRDGDQALSGLTMHLPAGVAALLSSVELCSEAQAAGDSCPAASEVGHATAVAGLGSEPILQEGGRVFITGPYGGAPFGLEIVTPAKAGPFDLGFVTVRSKLFIDPHDASVTIVSDPLPTQIRGIPLQLKRVLVDIDRPGFQFNGTSCDPNEITATVRGDEGAALPVASRYQVGGCEALPFTPKLSASVTGKGSRVNGTRFTVRLESAGLGQANIHKVLLQLPKVLPSRLETLKKACLAATFEANPATCNPESVIGSATIHTPVLKNPLVGPAYLVSHGNAAFPDVEFVLQGEGITLVVDGQTDIKGGITYSKFETAPDAPFRTFETVLPAGPKSVLAVYNAANADEPYSVCGTKLMMPTTIVSQDNKVIETETSVTTSGCSGVKSNRSKKLSLRQQYAKALKACRSRFKHNRRQLTNCERRAQTVYTAKALAACRHAHRPRTRSRKTCEAQAHRTYGFTARRPGRR